MIFGGLHIEIAALESMGSLLQHTGWTSALELLLKVYQGFFIQSEPTLQLFSNKTGWFWSKKCEIAFLLAK